MIDDQDGPRRFRVTAFFYACSSIDGVPAVVHRMLAYEKRRFRSRDEHRAGIRRRQNGGRGGINTLTRLEASGRGEMSPMQGSAISQAGYSPVRLVQATVPGTVLTSLVNDGVFPSRFMARTTARTKFPKASAGLRIGTARSSPSPLTTPAGMSG